MSENGNMSFGKRLIQLRQKRGWSQEELAQRAGFAGQSFISLLESGVRNPSWATQKALAKALGMKIGVLMEGVEK